MASSAQAGAAGPKPIATPGAQHEQAERKDLASWWRAFKRSDKKAQEQQGTRERRFLIPFPMCGDSPGRVCWLAGRHARMHACPCGGDGMGATERGLFMPYDSSHSRVYVLQSQR